MSAHPRHGAGGPPLVSVLCLTYNQEQFVAEAMDGILAQDYPAVEVVVCDDGSTDRTLDIVREYAARAPGRVTVVGGPHVGITANCNRGLAACRGEFVALTAGDDVLLPGKIARQIEWLAADAKRVVCGHDVEAFDSATGAAMFLWSEYFPLRTGVGPAAAVRSIPFCATAIVVRRSAVPAWHFDSRLPMISDWKLVIDCLHPDGVYGYVDGVYARYRRHPRNVTNVADAAHSTRMFAETLMLFAIVEAEHPPLLTVCRRARAEHLLAEAKRQRDRGSRRAAWQYGLAALRESPEEIAGWAVRRAVRAARGRR